MNRAFRPEFIKVVYLNPWMKISMKYKACLAPVRSLLNLGLLYALDHAYFTLILIYGLKINYEFEINHLREFGP